MILPVHAQTFRVPGAYHIFIDAAADIGSNGVPLDRVIFVDLVTGEPSSTLIAGDRYTVLRNAVMLLDTATDRVMLLLPDGTLRPHPFVQKPDGSRRIDWVLSPDDAFIAWTITDGTPDALTTRTYTAEINGANQTEVFTDTPHDGVRAYPVAYDPVGGVLYMDYQPDAIGDFAPLRQYAALFTVNVRTGETQSLPSEPGCFCGAGITVASGSARLIRLALRDGLNGFDARLVDLANGTTSTISALNLTGFTQNGDVLIAPDGTQAIYTLAQIRGFGTPAQTIQSVFVLIDLSTLTQRTLTDPANTLFRPVAWTADGILVTSPITDGTWRIDLVDGDLELIAGASYLGAIMP